MILFIYDHSTAIGGAIISVYLAVKHEGGLRGIGAYLMGKKSVSAMSAHDRAELLTRGMEILSASPQTDAEKKASSSVAPVVQPGMGEQKQN